MGAAAPSPAKAGHNNMAAGRLLGLIERVERLQEEIKVLQEDIKDIKQEAKSAGFDLPTFNLMLKERKLSQAELEEAVALAEIYRKALGMLSETPLGAAAVKRLTPPDEPPAAPGDEPPAAEAPAAAPTAADIGAARLAGADAQARGVKVTANPHPFGDPRRAAWDGGWCQAAGNDGMDIPSAWKRTDTKKDAKK